MKWTINPKTAPYQKDPSRRTSAIPTDNAGEIPLKIKSPDIPASATPMPPGTILIPPISEEKLNINVESEIFMYCPKPMTT